MSAFLKPPLSFKRIRGISSPGKYPSFTARTTGVSNPIRSPSFHLSVSVSAQQSAFAVALGFDGGFKKPPTDALRPIILDNACILYITAVAGTKLVDAYSPNTFNTSSPGKEAHDLDNHECQSHSI
ncbi:hypothetical protein Goklo_004894 [Gossypium klotzschianum]|uniref:Uncharacterized protein n=1 Tax=Gossypium klotzschianum TaxID=34286 RepID=A0A7J8VQB4_9ROSI|nr:hypothetical protein [Gossypium klotzschianum]